MPADDTVPPPTGAFPVDLREGVIWAYRLLLGREPNDEQAVAFHLDHSHSVAAVRAAFLGSDEYQLAHLPPSVSAAHAAVIAAFRPFCSTPAPVGSWHDFLGVRTQCDYLPDDYKSFSGTVQGPPGAPNGPMHDIEEWVVDCALGAGGARAPGVRRTGAGWAPWLVASAKAAAHVDIHEVRLIGIEGSAGHVAFMRRHLADNGIDPDAHTLLHAVAGPHDGVARFPKLLEPQNVYGGQADYLPAGDAAAMEEVGVLPTQNITLYQTLMGKLSEEFTERVYRLVGTLFGSIFPGVYHISADNGTAIPAALEPERLAYAGSPGCLW